MKTQKPWRARYIKKKLPGVVAIGYEGRKNLFLKVFDTRHLLLLAATDPAPLLQNIVQQLSCQAVNLVVIGTSQGFPDIVDCVPADMTADFLQWLDGENTRRLHLRVGKSLPRVMVVVPQLESLALAERNLLLKIISLSQNTGIGVIASAKICENSRAAAVAGAYLPFGVIVADEGGLLYAYGAQSQALRPFEIKWGGGAMR